MREHVARKERTAHTRQELFGMPQSKRLEDGLPRERFEESKSLACVARKENVLLLGQKRLMKKLSWLRRPHVLLIDEVGYEPLTMEQAHVLFPFISTRCKTGSIVMTSSKSVSKQAELMSDGAVATVMLARLLHRTLVYRLKGDSHRMRAWN